MLHAHCVFGGPLKAERCCSESHVSGRKALPNTAFDLPQAHTIATMRPSPRTAQCNGQYERINHPLEVDESSVGGVEQSNSSSCRNGASSMRRNAFRSHELRPSPASGSRFTEYGKFAVRQCSTTPAPPKGGNPQRADNTAFPRPAGTVITAYGNPAKSPPGRSGSNRRACSGYTLRRRRACAGRHRQTTSPASPARRSRRAGSIASPPVA